MANYQTFNGAPIAMSGDPNIAGIGPSYGVDQAANPSIWQNVGTVLPSVVQGASSAVSAAQVANANAEAASGVKAAGANSAALLNPYAESGTAAENQLLSLYGVNGSPAQAAAQANFAATPGYQFTKDMGTQAIQRQASATGGEFSSATLGALDQYNTGLAQQTYQNYIQNLFGLVQPGASAAGAAGQQGIQAATQAGNFTVGKGNANASGVQGVAGALTNGLLNPATSNYLFGNGTNPGAISSIASKIFGSGGANTGVYAPGAAYGGSVDPDYQGYVPNSTDGQTNESVTPGMYNDQGYMNLSGDSGGSSYFNDSGGDSASGYFNAAGGEAANGIPTLPTDQAQLDSMYGNNFDQSIQNNASYTNLASPPTSSTSPVTQIAGKLGEASNAFNVYQGLQRGGVSGYASAAVNSAALGNKLGVTNIPYVGPAGNVLGLYNGLKQGGVQGYTNAAVNAAQLYSTASAADVAAGGTGFAGAGAAGAAGTVAIPVSMALYGASQAPVTYSRTYWDGVRQSLQNGNSGKIGGLNYGAGSQQAQYNQQTAQTGLLYDALNAGADKADIGKASGMQIPPDVIAAYPGGATKFYSDLASLKASLNKSVGKAGPGISVGSRSTIEKV